MKKIIILDYQLGNLFSVNQACQKVKINSSISSNWKDIKKADAIILPGVGSYYKAMDNIKKLDLINPLNDFIFESKPLFGICLGMQLLFSDSEEFGKTEGLGHIKGSIKKFKKGDVFNKRMRIPQIGWNTIKNSNNQLWRNSPLKTLKKNDYMYFIHSYYAIPYHESNILSTTNYENFEYVSSISNNKNIFATQFHPEKSGTIGLAIYKNWAMLNDLI